MPFPITYVLDRLAPSETFIRRELDQLRRREWPVYTRLLNGGVDPLAFSLLSCPEGFRWRFFRAAATRLTAEILRSPRMVLGLLVRLPQAAQLTRQVVETDSILIHAHFAGIAADIAALAARALGRPWTCSVHARDVFAAPPARLRRRLCSAACVTACSQAAADAVIAAGVPRERVSVICHGLPLRDYPFNTIQPEGRLFAACRLEPKKGVDTLVRACALLRERGLHFECAIAGSGALHDSLAALARELKVSDRVAFPGWLSPEEVRSRITDASVVALPSRRTRDGDRDGISNMLLEAMALGTPVVTTAAGAAGEVITDAVNGLLVPPDDPPRLADALAALLTSKTLRARLAAEARRTVEARFDGAANIRKLEAFFASAAASP